MGEGGELKEASFIKCIDLTPPQSFCDQWLSQKTEKAAFMKKITNHTFSVRVQIQHLVYSIISSCKTVSKYINHILTRVNKHCSLTIKTVLV